MRPLSALCLPLLGLLLAIPSSAQGIFLAPGQQGAGITFGYTRSAPLAGATGVMSLAVSQRIDAGLGVTHMSGRSDSGWQSYRTTAVGPALSFHPARQMLGDAVNITVSSLALLGSVNSVRFGSLSMGVAIARDIDPAPRNFVMPFVGGSFTPILIHRDGASSDVGAAVAGGLTIGFPLTGQILMTIEPSGSLMRDGHALTLSLGLVRLSE